MRPPFLISMRTWTLRIRVQRMKHALSESTAGIENLERSLFSILSSTRYHCRNCAWSFFIFIAQRIEIHYFGPIHEKIADRYFRFHEKDLSHFTEQLLTIHHDFFGPHKGPATQHRRGTYKWFTLLPALEGPVDHMTANVCKNLRTCGREPKASDHSRSCLPLPTRVA